MQLRGGYNSVFGSDLPDMRALNNSMVYADNNYWGYSEPAIYCDGTSSILIYRILDEDPVPSCSYENATVNRLTMPEDSSNGYWLAVSEGIQGNTKKAKELLLQLINGKFNIKYSPLALLA